MELQTGIKGKAQITVQQKDTAAAYGSGLVEVFATPAMIALMELAAHTSVGQYLPQGNLTVGTELNIKHLKATAIGKKVWAESILTHIDGRKLTFEILAFDEDGQIGEGTHTRFIVDKEKFMSKL